MYPTEEPVFEHQPYRGNGGQQVSAKRTTLGNNKVKKEKQDARLGW